MHEYPSLLVVAQTKRVACVGRFAVPRYDSLHTAGEPLENSQYLIFLSNVAIISSRSHVCSSGHGECHYCCFAGAGTSVFFQLPELQNVEGRAKAYGGGGGVFTLLVFTSAFT